MIRIIATGPRSDYTEFLETRAASRMGGGCAAGETGSTVLAPGAPAVAPCLAPGPSGPGGTGGMLPPRRLSLPGAGRARVSTFRSLLRDRPPPRSRGASGRAHPPVAGSVRYLPGSGPGLHRSAAGASPAVRGPRSVARSRLGAMSGSVFPRPPSTRVGDRFARSPSRRAPVCRSCRHARRAEGVSLCSPPVPRVGSP